jgi:hypothetical protein
MDFDFLSRNDLVQTAEQIIDQIENFNENFTSSMVGFAGKYDIQCQEEKISDFLKESCKLIENKIHSPEKRASPIQIEISNSHNSQQEEILFTFPSCKTDHSMITSPSKFNPLHSTTSSSTNLVYENSFLSVEDNIFSNSTCSNTGLNNNLTMVNKSKMTNDKIVYIKHQLENEIANFSGLIIGDEGAKKISEILISSQFSFSPNKRKISKLKELRFTKSNIGDEGFSYLSNSLEKTNSIHTIVLNKNRIKDESYTNILNLIKNNKQLKKLNLLSNFLTSPVIEKIRSISKNINPNLKIEI